MKGKKVYKRSRRPTKFSTRRRPVRRSTRRKSVKRSTRRRPVKRITRRRPVKRSTRRRSNTVRKTTLRSNKRTQPTRRKLSGKRRVNGKYKGEGGARAKLEEYGLKDNVKSIVDGFNKLKLKVHFKDDYIAENIQDLFPRDRRLQKQDIRNFMTPYAGDDRLDKDELRALIRNLNKLSSQPYGNQRTALIKIMDTVFSPSYKWEKVHQKLEAAGFPKSAAQPEPEPDPGPELDPGSQWPIDLPDHYHNNVTGFVAKP